MKLSTLLYEIVRGSITMPNPNISVESLTNSIVDKEDVGTQWALQVSAAFKALNLALSRLQDYRKIPFSHDFHTIFTNNVADFDKGEIVNVVIPSFNGYENIKFRTFDRNTKVELISRFEIANPIIEYKKTIPHFSESSLSKITEDGDSNVDLTKEYGITDQMCDYIIEFACAQIMEVVAPDLSNLHNSRAEQYFAGLETVGTAYRQDHVSDFYNFRGILR